MPFQPGNTLASKGGLWRQTLDRAIKQEDGKRLREAAEALLSAAANGDMTAIKELADRLDGKSPQSMQIEGGDTPILTKAIVELIHASSGSDTKTSTP